MKIGVLTFWESKDNYGQILQAFAMQKYLESLGHTPFLIRYRETPQTVKTGFQLAKLAKYLLNFRAYCRYIIQRRRERKYISCNDNKRRDFDGFIAAHVSVSENIYDDAAIHSVPPEAEAYICGSDQIWGGNTTYYLSFAPANTKKIAFAPSFGGANPFAGNNTRMVKQLLGRLDFIGMREAAGATLLKKEGFDNATQVIDPTMLLDSSAYLALTRHVDKGRFRGKAFVYMLGNPTVYPIEKVFKYLRNEKLDYTYVASQGKVDKYPKSALTIPEWLAAISCAKVVITNSFHCVVFALTFHKPFVFLPLAGAYARMNDRIEDLCRNCGINPVITIETLNTASDSLDAIKFETYRTTQYERSSLIFKELLS